MNRSIPPGVIPELPYPDVREAVDCLCRSFGFTERTSLDFFPTNADVDPETWGGTLLE